MKTFLLYTVSILANLTVLGKPTDPPVKKNEFTVSIQYLNHTKKAIHRDSVLVIFDKYDRTGPGIIRKVFYPDHHHPIKVSRVPAGKYYVTIHFMGFHHETFQRTIYVKRKNKRLIRVKLNEWEEYSPKAVRIPVEEPDWTDLLITKMN